MCVYKSHRNTTEKKNYHSQPLSKTVFFPLYVWGVIFSTFNCDLIVLGNKKKPETWTGNIPRQSKTKKKFNGSERDIKKGFIDHRSFKINDWIMVFLSIVLEMHKIKNHLNCKFKTSFSLLSRRKMNNNEFIFCNW